MRAVASHSAALGSGRSDDEVTQGCFSLLRYDAVAEGFELRVVREVEVSDEAGGQAHQPLGEGRGEPRLATGAAFCWTWCWSTEDGFPAADGRLVDTPGALSGNGNRAPTTSGNVIWCRLPVSGRVPWLSLAVGVGSSLEQTGGFPAVSEDEDAPAVVRGADVGSFQACPHRVIPEAGQVAEYAVEAAPTQGGNVLHDHTVVEAGECPRRL